MTAQEMRDLVIATINQHADAVNASPIEGGTKSVIGIENETTGELFFAEIAEA